MMVFLLLSIVAGSPAFLLPWALDTLQRSPDVRHAGMVYGIIFSSILLGRYLGTRFKLDGLVDAVSLRSGAEFGLKQPAARLHCILLFLSFFVLSGTTSGMMIAACGFVIGAVSASFIAVLEECSMPLLKRRQAKKNLATSLQFKNDLIRAQLCSLIFGSLLCGITYRAEAAVLLPAFRPCIILAAAFLALVLFGRVAEVLEVRGRRVMESVDGATLDYSAFDRAAAAEGDETEGMEDVEPSPQYIKAFPGNLAAAKKAYAKRLEWRRKSDVDNILQRPQKHIDLIMKCYPHGLHGRSKDGCLVVYELIGQGNSRELIGGGATPDDLLWHFNFRNEHIFKHLRTYNNNGVLSCVRSEGSQDEGVPVERLMTIIDVKGIKISDISSDVLSFMQKSSEVIDSYYPPGMVARLVICNAPIWFSSAWGMIAKVLPESVNNKVITVGRLSDLDKFIDPSQRPVNYGGTDPNPLGQSPDHLSFLRAIKSAGSESAPPLTISTSTAKLTTQSSSANLLKPDTPQRQPQLSIKSRPSSGTLKTSSSFASLPTPTTPSNRDSDMPKKGWFSNMFRSETKEAFLGSSNRFRFDAESNSWVLDDDFDEGSKQQQQPSGLESPSARNRKKTSTDSSSSSASAAQMASQGSGALAMTSEGSSGGGNSSISGSGAGSLARGLVQSGSLRDDANVDDDEIERIDAIEEHGLIVAIQAAHKAREAAARMQELADLDQDVAAHLGGRIAPSSLQDGTASLAGELGLTSRMGLGSMSSGDLLRRSASRDTSSILGGFGGPDLFDDDVESDTSLSGPAVRISGPLFLYALTSHVFACFCQSAAVILLPLWLFATSSQGGLHYSVMDFALVLSCCGSMLLAAFSFINDRVALVVASSPARAVRIGTGCMAFAIACLPLLAKSTIMAVAGSSSVAKLFLSPTPSRTPLALLLPSALSALLIIGSHITRSATQTIFSTCAASSLAMSETVLNAVSGAADISAPIIGSALFSLFHKEGVIQLPLQSFVVLYAILIVQAVMYSSTLVLNVHFRGDFGVVTERVVGISSDSRRAFRCCCLGGASSDRRIGGRGGSSAGRGRGGNSSSSSSGGGVMSLWYAMTDCISDALSVPLGDMHFFLSPKDAVSTHGGMVDESAVGLLSPSSTYKLV